MDLLDLPLMILQKMQLGWLAILEAWKRAERKIGCKRLRRDPGRRCVSSISVGGMMYGGKGVKEVVLDGCRRGMRMMMMMMHQSWEELRCRQPTCRPVRETRRCQPPVLKASIRLSRHSLYCSLRYAVHTRCAPCVISEFHGTHSMYVQSAHRTMPSSKPPADELTHASFWDQRYATEKEDDEPHEWFRSFDQLKAFLETHLAGEHDATILHLGCGLSVRNESHLQLVVYSVEYLAVPYFSQCSMAILEKSMQVWMR